MGTITTVNFKNDTLFAVERDDGIWVAVTPICQSLGIDPQKQRRRISEDPILGEGVCQAVFPSAGGQQETTCIRLDLVNGWLFGINDKLVKDDETRQRVLAYKRECYAVLHRHFYGRTAEQRATGLADAVGEPRTDEPMNIRRQLVAEARQTHSVQAARELWFKLGLPTVPAMYAEPRQSDFFTYTAIRRDATDAAEGEKAA